MLVEKDWCAFGHMFERRCRLPTTDNTSPIFLLFLDAVFQLMAQFPKCFQFNSSFLIEVGEAVYSGWYGNFIRNCERERAPLIREHSLVSIWDVLRATTDKYLNPLFTPVQQEKDTLPPPIFPVCKVRCMQVWSGMYQKAISEVQSHRYENAMIQMICAQEGQISEMLRLLTPDQHLQLRILQIEAELHRLVG